MIFTYKYEFEGVPSICMIKLSCSCSFEPAKIGEPKYSYESKHPALHISIEEL